MLSDLYSLVTSKEIFKCLNTYPDLEYNSMQELIRKRYHIENILFGSGSEELIFRINRELLRNRRVAVMVPIFYRVTETLDNSLVYLDINDYMKDGEDCQSEFYLWDCHFSCCPARCHKKLFKSTFYYR